MLKERLRLHVEVCVDRAVFYKAMPELSDETNSARVVGKSVFAPQITLSGIFSCGSQKRLMQQIFRKFTIARGDNKD